MPRHTTTGSLLLAIAILCAVLVPSPAEAVQAQVILNCGTGDASVSGASFIGTSLTSTTPINFATDASGFGVTNGVYVHPGDPGVIPVVPADPECKFKIIGNAQFTADASKIGQLLLNNLSIRNVGTKPGSVKIFYRHQNRSADPNTVQCVSLSADGFFYFPGGFPAGDKFELNMQVQYFKSGAPFQTFNVGIGLLSGNPPVSLVGSCPKTVGSDDDGYFDNGTSHSYTVVNDAFFNPQRPAQVFNRIPGCTGCTTGTTSTSGARINKTFVVTLKVGHEISSISTVRGAMAEQAANNSNREAAREALANAKFVEFNAEDCARIDHKPGASENFLHATQDQGHVTVDLQGGPCFDIADVDLSSLRLFAGTSGLNTQALTPEFHGDGAPLASFTIGDFNGDGFPDVRGHYRQSELEVVSGDDRVQLRGTFLVPDGTGVPKEFRAEDSAITQ